jgi:hypothetical protein
MWAGTVKIERFFVDRDIQARQDPAPSVVEVGGERHSHSCPGRPSKPPNGPLMSAILVKVCGSATATPGRPRSPDTSPVTISGYPCLGRPHGRRVRCHRTYELEYWAPSG